MKKQEVGRFHAQKRRRGGPSRGRAGDRRGTPGDNEAKPRECVLRRTCVYVRINGWRIWRVCSREKPHGDVSYGAFGRRRKNEGFKSYAVENRQQSGGSAGREDAERSVGNQPQPGIPVSARLAVTTESSSRSARSKSIRDGRSANTTVSAQS